MEALRGRIDALPKPRLANAPEEVLGLVDLDIQSARDLASPDKTAEQLALVGMIAHADEEWDVAKAWYALALEIKTEYALSVELKTDEFMPHFYYARVLLALDDVSAAYREALTACALDPADTSARLLKAELLLRMVQDPAPLSEVKIADIDVTRAFEAASAEHPNARAHYGLGEFHRFRGRMEQAIAEFRQAVEIDPAFKLARLSWAEALTAVGRGSEAAAIREAAARITRESQGYQCPHMAYLESHASIDALKLRYAMALVAQGRDEEAESYVRLMTVQDPGNAAAFNALGNIMFVSRQQNTSDQPLLQLLLRQEAKKAYTAALEIDPTFHEARRNYAMVLKAENELDAAKEQLSFVVSVDPKQWMAQYDLGKLLQEGEDWIGAEEHYRASIVQYPVNMPAHSGLAEVLYKQGRFQEMYDVLRSATLKAPNDARIADQLARLLLECPTPDLCNPAEAVDIAERVVELMGTDYPEFIETLAQAYRATAKSEDGINVDRMRLARDAMRRAFDAAAIKKDATLMARCRAFLEEVDAFLKEKDVEQ